MMERVKKTLHRGKDVILLDLSNSKPEETIVTLPAAEKVISACSTKSALVLTDVTNATYNKEVAEAIKHLVQFNTPYIKASAIVGADGIRQILLNTVIFLTRREIKTFNDRQKAMDWLISN